jgi:acetyl-CoA synthetase
MDTPEEITSYEDARERFRWNIPERFNIGVDVCDRWAAIDRDRTAIIAVRDDHLSRTSFGELRATSNQLANWFIAQGIRKGDRIGVLMPQRLETAVAHIAIYKIGAIAVPLFSLFGLDAIRHRLNDSGTRLVICDRDGRTKIEQIRAELSALESVLCVDDESGTPVLGQVTASQPVDFDPVETAPDDPALIIYTSGTTGASKGALHGHGVLLGHLPGVEMSHDGFPKPGDCMWTPADWAWIGGLLDVLLPSLHHGVPVVAQRFPKFEADAAFRLIARCGVRNVFLPPTALKVMRAEPNPRSRYDLSLRSVASGGETLGAELLNWGKEALGVQINEFYGQTECNMIVSSCGAWFSPKPGWMGKPAPGHDVQIIDDRGAIVPEGREGDIGVRSPDPVMFLRYWRQPQATAEKYRGAWLMTGDRGSRDSAGFIHFLGRSDDVITSGGYRIGPGEIEDCLIRHPSVMQAGVVGSPDSARTEVVTAFVVLRPGTKASDDLVTELQNHVRTRLGGHQYPRRVFFVETLPMTVTGKVIRRELRRIAEESCAPGAVVPRPHANG